MFFLFSVAAGFAHGGMSASQPPIVAGLFGIKSHGLILGVCNSCLLIGSALGPFVAGYIFDVSGSYRLAFTICASASVVGLIMIFLLKPTSRPGIPKGSLSHRL